MAKSTVSRARKGECLSNGVRISTSGEFLATTRVHFLADMTIEPSEISEERYIVMRRDPEEYITSVHRDDLARLLFPRR